MATGCGFPFLSEKAGETVLAVYVQPRAGKSGFAGVFQERLKIRISAPPVEGEANKECIEFLAKALGVAKSEVRLAKGGQSRQKTFIISRPLENIYSLLKVLIEGN